MIITLTQANFSSCNIGTLTTFNVRKSTVIGASVNIIKTSVERAGYSSATTIATIVLDKVNYEGHAIKVMMGSTDVSSWYSSGKVTVPKNTPITSNITISVSATAVSGGEVVDPEEPGTGGDIGGDSGETITGTLQLFSGAVSVVSGENYYRPATANKARMNSSSVTEPTGVYVEHGYAITLTGVSGLRFDYIYAESAGPNSNDKHVNAIKGVGTASKFNASDYFPLNKTGESNTITITNNLGRGYYYHFAIAGPNKNEQLTPSDYNITYKIEPASIDTTKYTLIQGGINITPNESVYGTVLGSSDVNYKKRGHTEPAIFIKNGESVTISGLTGLKLDAVWYNSPVMNNANAVGSASNKVDSNYFFLTDGNTDTYTYTNSTGSDYYYAFIVRNSDNTNFNASDYTLTIK